jgi:phage I-like protein
MDLIKDRPLEALRCMVGDVAGGEGIKEVRLCPAGEVKSKSGAFVMDREAARLIQAALTEHETPLPIDYEHQTLGGRYASPDGRAPAAGWIHEVYFDEGKGLMALVKWNEKGAEMIRGGEYLYLSPVLGIRQADRRAVELHSAALTNKPAIPAMDRLAASERIPKMELTVMADEPEGSKDEAAEMTPEQWVEKIGGLVGVKFDGHNYQEVFKAAAEALEGKASAAQQTGAVASSAPILAELVALREEIAEVRNWKASKEIDDVLRVWIDKGCICTEGSFGYQDMSICRELARNSPRAFARFMGERKRALPPEGRTTPPSEAQSKRGRVIRNAVLKYTGEPTLQKTTDRNAWVALALREAGMEKLADGELKPFV